MNNLLIFIYFCFLFILNKSSTYGLYNITTLYKYNSYENKTFKNQYLDSCTLSLHPDDDAMGLPYYFKRKKSDDMYNIMFPELDETDNLFLETNLYKTQWKVTNSTEIRDSDVQDIMFTNLERNVEDMNVDNIIGNDNDFFEVIKRNILNNKLKILKSEIVSKDSVYNSPNNRVESTIFEQKDLESFLNTQVPFLHLKYIFRNPFLIELKSNNIIINIDIAEDSITYSTDKGKKEQIFDYIPDLEHIFTELYIFVNPENSITFFNIHKLRWGTLSLGEKMPKFQDMKSIKCFIENHLFLTVQCELGYFLAGPVVVPDNSVIVSPRLNKLVNDSILHVIHYNTKRERTPHAQISYNNQTKDLESLDKTTIKIHEPSGQEIALTRFNINFPPIWDGTKRIIIKCEKNVFIKYIWYSGKEKVYEIVDEMHCPKNDANWFPTDRVESNFYNIPIATPPLIVKDSQKERVCTSGGILNMDICLCPPGFVGSNCEIPCGRNKFGQTCSHECSNSTRECQGMVLCTPSYGCACAPGYYGNHCSNQCRPRTFGNNCKQRCGKCKGKCDIYSGFCKDGCANSYLIPPRCKKNRSYFKEGPTIVDSTFDSIKIKIDFSESNIEKSTDTPTFYRVEYKHEKDKTWLSLPQTLLNETDGIHRMLNLKSGQKYFFRVILIDKTLQTHDPLLSKISEGITQCSTPQHAINMNATEGIFSRIKLSWEEKESLNVHDCPSISYTVEVQDTNNSTIKRTYKNIYENTTVITVSEIGHSYEITLRRNTISGLSDIIARTSFNKN